MNYITFILGTIIGSIITNIIRHKTSDGIVYISEDETEYDVNVGFKNMQKVMNSNEIRLDVIHHKHTQ